MREFIFEVSGSENGVSALDLLKNRGFSRRIVTRLKQSGGLTRNGGVLRSVDRVFAGEQIRVVLEDSGNIPPNPDIHAEIAFENDDLIIFDKPPFLAVHQSLGHYTDTLANLYAAMFPNSTFRPINRLDKNTSGLCVCAKHRLSAAQLAGTLQKTYFAVVDGDIPRAGEINAPIGRVSDSIIKREVRADGQYAVTQFEPVLRNNGRTLLKIKLKTGRTHQIRVHFSYLGYPLCGDEMYGGDCSDISRQALHCGEVLLTDPCSGEIIALQSPLPEDMERLLT